MILLNTKSILDCNEKESEVHFKEIEDLFEKISNDDKMYDIQISHLDPYQKKRKHTKNRQMKMSEIEDFIQNFDIKNGADIYNEQKNLVFVLYGQTYNYENNDYIITTQLYTKKV